VIILKPRQGHKGDSFRELLDIWESEGLCKLEDSPDGFCWVDKPGKILLYDHPRVDDRPVSPFEYGLFGNTIPNCADDRCKPWIFWGRKPKLIEKHKKEFRRSYQDRKIESIFLGKIENQVQLNNRSSHDWSDCIELFSMPVMMGDTNRWPYTQEEYLEKLSYSKFGLCLPGYGPKCNREIEYMAFGVVPIVTPGVDTTYYNKLVENVHFIKISSPEDIDKLREVKEEEWKTLSDNCISWYEENCSSYGSFSTTCKILNEVFQYECE